jgi:hypothetical protein
MKWHEKSIHISLAASRTLPLLVKMWTPQCKVQCVLWLAELKSVTGVQRCARREWNVYRPTCKSIYEWDKTLRETGSLISHAGKHPKEDVTRDYGSCARVIL